MLRIIIRSVDSSLNILPLQGLRLGAGGKVVR